MDSSLLQKTLWVLGRHLRSWTLVALLLLFLSYIKFVDIVNDFATKMAGTGDFSVVMNGTTYNLVPTRKHVQPIREARSRVMKYSDPLLKGAPEFKYEPLPNVKKRIRLIRLRHGFPDSSTIDCELFDVEYNDKHKPVLVSDNTTVQEYEALSWCWGTWDRDYAINISRGHQIYKMAVSRELALALKYLRKPNQPRVMWIDAICIDQSNTQERNHQVQMMSLIYTRAQQVCVWLGEDDDDSNLAIRFIRDEILKFENFDAVCSNKGNADKWRALLMLMQRPWFSRRWVVQEIALAQRATVHCGPEEIPWKDFAVAVELFVEVETATHRLSEVMQKDERFYHVPGWFEYVSELGASLLVSATGKIFRQYQSQDGASQEKDIGLMSRRGLQSLEYLVSSLFTFHATEPRDAIYSLLAIARDTSPLAESPAPGENSDDETLFMKAFATFLERKPYAVDYDRAYADVCTDFVDFCVERTKKSDPARALDILCRPWALPPRKDYSAAQEADKGAEKPKEEKDRKKVVTPLCPLRNPEEVWRIKVKKRVSAETKANQQELPDELLISTLKEGISSHENGHGDTESSSDAGGGGNQARRNLPDTYPRTLKTLSSNHGPPGNQHSNSKALNGSQNARSESNRAHVTPERPAKPGLKEERGGSKPEANEEDEYETLDDPRSNEEYWNESIQKTVQIFGLQGKEAVRLGVRDVVLKQLSKNKVDLGKEDKNPVGLPSWIASIEGAPYALFRNPGIMDVKKMGRKNADSLVGPPEDGRRNYTAAQSKSADFSTLRLRKRPGYHSLYVKGFVLGRVKAVGPPSQNGAIPQAWFGQELGQWEEALDALNEGNPIREPPDDFWRTLVADRGKDNRNPPYYYAKACAESVAKGGLQSGAVSTTELIHNERNSIIAEFCRRVQAVIWNRKLIRAELEGTKQTHLGLVSNGVKRGDLVCILYGCTVPVILRKSEKKSDAVVKDEQFEDVIEWMRTKVRKFEQLRLRKARYLKRLWGDGEEETLKSSSSTREFEKINKSKWNKEELDSIKILTKHINEEMKRWEQERREKEKNTADSEERMKEAVKRSAEAIQELTGDMKSSAEEGKKEGEKTLPGNNANRSRTMKVDSETHAQRAKEAKEEDPFFYYELKGECYLHGMMDGAAMREQFYEGLPERVFEIR